MVLYFVLGAWWLINFVLLLADSRRQTAWDKALNAVVINDHDRRFDPRSPPPTARPASPLPHRHQSLVTITFPNLN